MKLLPFKTSSIASIGVELEFQIINPTSYALNSRAKELMRKIKTSPYAKKIKPEITQSMIEINSSIHSSPAMMFEELKELQTFLLTQGKEINLLFCGGGIHPFQQWTDQKIFPSKRFKKMSSKYRYLSKRSTVFGQHVHIGCNNTADALYLTHALARYIPQLLAISASSPFYQEVDTGYCSTRSTIVNGHPLSGIIPYVNDWQAFSDFFYKMEEFKIIESMKDFYWDVRPKPEFGTVEIRICDTPLTIKKAIIIVAYIQALALYLLETKPFTICQEIYYFYDFNRFQAGRYSFDGDFIDAVTSKRLLIVEDILETIKIITPYANRLGSMNYISLLLNEVLCKHNDAKHIKHIYNEVHSFPEVVKEQCALWSAALLEGDSYARYANTSQLEEMSR